MELNGYRLLLPEGTLDYFDLVDVKESVNEVVIYLEEKNIVPEKYTDQDTESKGFYDPIIVQDFPLRGKKVFLNIRRRRWLLKKHNEYISRNWRMVAEGTRMEGVSKCTPSFHIYSIQRNLIVSSGTVHIQLSLMIVLKQYHG